MADSSHRIARLVLAGILSVGSVAHGQPASRGQAAPPNAGELDASAAFERARIYYESARYVPCVDAFTRLLEHATRHHVCTMNTNSRPLTKLFEKIRVDLLRFPFDLHQNLL